jgi:hypothetical protein
MKTAAFLAAAVLLVGCGGAERAAGLGTDAAQLVPPDATAFISVDARFDSEQWRMIEELGFSPVELVIGQFDLERDVEPALGDEIHFAVVGDDGVAFTQPEEESKLRRLLESDADEKPVFIDRVGDWMAVAETRAAMDAVRRAHAGRSLADDEQFRAATDKLEGDALATAYATDATLVEFPEELRALVGQPRWLAAAVTTEDDAVRLRAHTPESGLRAFRPRLLREVPSGAALAASFKDFPGLARGEGVLFAVLDSPVPSVVLTLETPTPRAAERAFDEIAARLPLAMNVIRHGTRVTLTNVPFAPRTPAPGDRLVDDVPFKEALADADVPEEVTWLAYADIQRLAPIAPTFWPELPLPRLGRAGTLVAFGTPSGLEARLTSR